MLNIATVCGMGFGTSLMLAMQVRDLMLENQIDANVEPVDLASYKTMDAQVVVAPRDMENQLHDGPAQAIVLIDNLVDQEELSQKVLAAVKTLD
ncbi:hypothetical protein BSR29_01080 [Boudabousia liubingyangii]|uniref:PTS EIIB type-2 domain-containing protein n=1 Tax=Boudabousia liubingyangii TaxID=1921764 RepID=A0A1Q5PPZ2_9ACTO|nr:PTS sugar transporter subunit IIB [Boudabousia liubingyangii]OKL48392.1 hypothetical protein BSR28_01440 [Boudabousia liubingyangii]OKL49582.1 hypothetical protein BSR29_01080 [Boudabousia liubingyangii]